MCLAAGAAISDSHFRLLRNTLTRRHQSTLTIQGRRDEFG